MCNGSIWKIEIESNRLIICSPETRKLIDPYKTAMDLFSDIKVPWFKKILWKLGLYPPFKITDCSYCYKMTSSQYDVGVKRLGRDLKEPLLFGVMELIQQKGETFCRNGHKSLA
jgi:hypothetical protein